MSPEDGEMVCSQIIETENRLIIIDVQLLRPYAAQLRRYVDGLDKPIDRVIVTHSHPDHWFGLEYFEDVPLYALPEVIAEIEQLGDSYLDYKRSQHGPDLIAAHKVVPSNVLQEGEAMIDGVRFAFTKIIGAESSVMAVTELPDLKVLLPQDLVYNRVYLYVGEKSPTGTYCFDAWLHWLEQSRERDYDVVLPGHGEPTDATIFDRAITYLRDARQAFEQAPGPDELKQMMIDRYPTYRVAELLDLTNVFLYNLFQAAK